MYESKAYFRSHFMFCFNKSPMHAETSILDLVLAHLSQRLMGELIVCESLRRPSGVCSSTFRNTFSKTTGPIKLKLHKETLSDAGTKVCSNGPGHLTQMAATPIYGKNPLKIFSRTRKPMTLGLGM